MTTSIFALYQLLAKCKDCQRIEHPHTAELGTLIDEFARTLASLSNDDNDLACDVLIAPTGAVRGLIARAQALIGKVVAAVPQLQHTMTMRDEITHFFAQEQAFRQRLLGEYKQALSAAISHQLQYGKNANLHLIEYISSLDDYAHGMLPTVADTKAHCASIAVFPALLAETVKHEVLPLATALRAIYNDAHLVPYIIQTPHLHQHLTVLVDIPQHLQRYAPLFKCWALNFEHLTPVSDAGGAAVVATTSATLSTESTLTRIAEQCHKEAARFQQQAQRFQYAKLIGELFKIRASVRQQRLSPAGLGIIGGVSTQNKMADLRFLAQCRHALMSAMVQHCWYAAFDVLLDYKPKLAPLKAASDDLKTQLTAFKQSLPLSNATAPMMAAANTIDADADTDDDSDTADAGAGKVAVASTGGAAGAAAVGAQHPLASSDDITASITLYDPRTPSTLRHCHTALDAVFAEPTDDALGGDINAHSNTKQTLLHVMAQREQVNTADTKAQRYERMKRYIRSVPELKKFNKAFRTRFQQLFMAYSVVASKLVAQNARGAGRSELLGPLADAAFGCGGVIFSVIAACAKYRVYVDATKIGSLGDIRDVMDAVEQVADELTLAYEMQLRLLKHGHVRPGDRPLDTASASKGAKIFREVNKKLAAMKVASFTNSPIDHMAEYLVSKIMMRLIHVSGELPDGVNEIRDFCLTVVKDKAQTKMEIETRLYDLLGFFRLQTRTGEIWPVTDIFTKPAIAVYRPDDATIELWDRPTLADAATTTPAYGARLGTLNEVKQRKGYVVTERFAYRVENVARTDTAAPTSAAAAAVAPIATPVSPGTSASSHLLLAQTRTDASTTHSSAAKSAKPTADAALTSAEMARSIADLATMLPPG